MATNKKNEDAPENSLMPVDHLSLAYDRIKDIKDKEYRTKLWAALAASAGLDEANTSHSPMWSDIKVATPNDIFVDTDLKMAQLFKIGVVLNSRTATEYLLFKEWIGDRSEFQRDGRKARYIEHFKQEPLSVRGKNSGWAYTFLQAHLLAGHQVSLKYNK